MAVLHATSQKKYEIWGCYSGDYKACLFFYDYKACLFFYDD